MSGVKITNWRTEYGDGIVARRGEILRTTVGSGVHGIAIEGTDDHDEMGVYIEPPEYVLGLREHRSDYIARTQPEGGRSGPGDTDLVLYSLRKYLHLAVKGNPTALIPLFASAEHVLFQTISGRELRMMRDRFLSQQALQRFLGYMHSQHERMMGRGKQNRVPSRPELIEQYGWDVKYGSHALRLAHQGLELACHGRLTLPLPDLVRGHVLACKIGEIPRDEVSAEIEAIEDRIRRMLDKGATALPEDPDIETIESWAIATQRTHWGWH